MYPGSVAKKSVTREREEVVERRRAKHYIYMAAACALAASVLSSVPRVEVSPAVYMPLLNFGFQNDHAAALKMGVRGLDTALTYGDRCVGSHNRVWLQSRRPTSSRTLPPISRASTST